MTQRSAKLWSRRDVLAGATVGIGVSLFARGELFLPTNAVSPLPAAPDVAPVPAAAPPVAVAPPSPADLEAQQLVSGIGVLRARPSWRVVGARGQSPGSVSVQLASATRQLTVDVHRRDRGSPPGVANTDRLSLYLSNGGSGSLATDEDMGLAVMALGAELRHLERRGLLREPASLVSLRERATSGAAKV